MDLWEAFGEDSDESDPEEDDNALDKEESRFADAVALFLIQHLLKKRKTKTSSKLSKNDISTHVIVDQASANGASNKVWSRILESKGFTVSSNVDDEDDDNKDLRTNDVFDVLVLLATTVDTTSELEAKADRMTVPGGLLILWENVFDQQPLDSSIWLVHCPHQIELPSSAKEKETIRDAGVQPKALVALEKWPCPIQNPAFHCPWLHQSPAVLQTERERLRNATISTTANEQREGRLSAASIEESVHRLNMFGYCVIPRLLDPSICQQWGDAVLSDLDVAASLLLEQEGVDLFHPHQSSHDPASYRELSMREDLRMDLRHGPSLNKLRGGVKGCQPWTITARDELNATSGSSNDAADGSSFFRGHPDLLEIVRRVMNPQRADLYPGNFGRYNFSGQGPDGSFQDVRVGPVGGIVSLPGSADQAIHADTPHLFEHVDGLPAHYINAFTPGCKAHARVGQTALVHGSHTLEFCVQHISNKREDNDTLQTDQSGGVGGGGGRDSWKSFVVRPCLELGDVLLFDCRTLHFGMANTSSDVRRPLLYTNMTQHWFEDPKNWDEQRRIFAEKA